MSENLTKINMLMPFVIFFLNYYSCCDEMRTLTHLKCCSISLHSELFTFKYSPSQLTSHLFLICSSLNRTAHWLLSDTHCTPPVMCKAGADITPPGWKQAWEADGQHLWKKAVADLSVFSDLHTRLRIYCHLNDCARVRMCVLLWVWVSWRLECGHLPTKCFLQALMAITAVVSKN